MSFSPNWFKLLAALAKEQEIGGKVFKFEVLWFVLGREDSCKEDGPVPQDVVAQMPASALAEPDRVTYYAVFTFDKSAQFNSIVLAAKAHDGALLPVAKACRSFEVAAGDAFRAEFTVSSA